MFCSEIINNQERGTFIKNRRITITVPEYNSSIVLGGLRFEKGGEFVVGADGGLQFNVSRSVEKDTHIVYAHFVDGRIFYIGESSKTFRDRMRLYIIHKGSTNVLVRRFIKRFLRNGRKVETFVFKPSIVTINEGLPINPYVGVEQTLIKIYRRQLVNRKDVAE